LKVEFIVEGQDESCGLRWEEISWWLRVEGWIEKRELSVIYTWGFSFLLRVYRKCLRFCCFLQSLHISYHWYSRVPKYINMKELHSSFFIWRTGTYLGLYESKIITEPLRSLGLLYHAAIKKFENHGTSPELHILLQGRIFGTAGLCIARQHLYF